MKKTKGIIGIFSFVDVFVAAVKETVKTHTGVIKVYSPVPVHELDEIVGKRETKIRVFTFFGALMGFALGWFLTLFTSFEWGLVTGGKPVASIPPFIIVSFEFAVLFGAFATFAGLFITTKMPVKRISKEYDERFTIDKFGLYVESPKDEAGEMKKFMKKIGAEEVKVAK